MTRAPAAFVLLTAALGFAGCGGAPPPPATATPVSPPPPPPTASALPPLTPLPTPPPSTDPARRAPPAALLHFWPFGSDAELVLFADAGGLLRSDLGAPALAAILAAAHPSLTPGNEQCLRQGLQGIREVVVGVGHGGLLVIARFDESAFPSSTCLAAAGGKTTSVKGAPEAFDVGGSVAAHVPGIWSLGDRDAVERALEPRRGPESFPSSVSLEKDEYAAWVLAAQQDGVSFSGSLESSSERLRVRLEGEVHSSLADEMDQGWQSAKARIGQLSLSAAEAKQVQKLADAVVLSHDGGQVAGSLDLHEPVADQARELGAVAALVRAAVHEYVLNGMKAEARNSIHAIARSFMAMREMERAESGFTRAKLSSFPPVPKTVPRGVAYPSSPADWKAWQPLKFSMDGPQRYQYEVRAASNGLSADIIARGDLDGDGKASEFRLHLRIEAGGSVVEDTPIVERNPRD